MKNMSKYIIEPFAHAGLANAISPYFLIAFLSVIYVNAASTASFCM